MIYLEYRCNFFRVSNSTGNVEYKNKDYDRAFDYASRTAEFYREHLVLITGEKLDVDEGVIIIGITGIPQIRRDIQDRRRRLSAMPNTRIQYRA